MSQSDSEGEADLPEEKPMFPYERLYLSAQDKADIEDKPEIEREAILAERNEQLERHEQNIALRRLMQSRAKDSKDASKKKRKASAADLDEGQRKSSRQRGKADSGNALAAYKKQREDKALLEERRKSGKPEPRKDPLLDDYSDADAEAESDNDYDRDDRKRRKRTPSPLPPKDDPVAELADVQRIRIGRENFAQVCYNPGFEETITNCYVRVCLGPGRIPGQNEYRLCSIKGLQEGRPYVIEGPNQKTVLVNKYVLAAHGKATKTWSFIECSNSRFTDDEWRRYRLTMANEDCRMPTRGQINAKLDQINKLIHHRFTDAEISNKLKAQNALADMVNRTTEKKELKEKIGDAEERGDDELVRELEDQLLNIVPMKLAFGTSIQPNQAQRTNTEGDRLAELNRRNQRQTTENIQKAAMLKRRAYKKKLEADRLTVPSKTLDEDLFGSASDISRAGTPVNGSRAGTPARSALGNGNDIPRSGTPLSLRTGGETKKGLPVIKKSKRDDEVLQGLDLGIDIEI